MVIVVTLLSTVILQMDVSQDAGLQVTQQKSTIIVSRFGEI
jgi:hypothetical protein